MKTIYLNDILSTASGVFAGEREILEVEPPTIKTCNYCSISNREKTISPDTKGLWLLVTHAYTKICTCSVRSIFYVAFKSCPRAAA